MGGKTKIPNPEPPKLGTLSLGFRGLGFRVQGVGRAALNRKDLVHLQRLGSDAHGRLCWGRLL